MDDVYIWQYHMFFYEEHFPKFFLILPKYRWLHDGTNLQKNLVMIRTKFHRKSVAWGKSDYRLKIEWDYTITNKLY